MIIMKDICHKLDGTQDSDCSEGQLCYNSSSNHFSYCTFERISPLICRSIRCTSNLDCQKGNSRIECGMNATCEGISTVGTEPIPGYCNPE